MVQLVMIRHGQSQWNLDNRFTGWTDVDLTEQGIQEARKAGQLVGKLDDGFDCAYTSVLTRAIRTLWLVLDEMDHMWMPQKAAWQLNERHYGALQGLNKQETREKHGDAQVHIWRRSYDTPPPALAQDDPRHPKFDPRYRGLDAKLLPATESLKSTLERVMPYWQQELLPHLLAGRNVMIAAHGNSIRALCKHLLDISDDDIPGLEIPTGNPLLFDFADGAKVIACRYLDESRTVHLPVSV